MKFKKMNHYIEITIDDKFHNKSIQDIFISYHLSKKLIHELRMSKDVFLNDQEIFQNFQTLLVSGDRLKFPFFIDEPLDFVPQDILIDIVYEDEFILVINKQAGIDVHPDTKIGLNTLVNGVAFYYQQTNQHRRVRYIHRLDHDTTGAIIFAKEGFVHNLYDYLLSQKEIKRYYLAITENKPPKMSGVINSPIGKDRHHNLKRIISKSGDEAKTAYKLLSSHKSHHVLELELFTGRTHQIRVHLASINCPILGDTLYGGASIKINRQALHAYKVKLIHPITSVPFIIEVPIPLDMKPFI